MMIVLTGSGDSRGSGAGAGSAIPLPQRSVAIVRLSSIGDIVLTEPVTAALRRAYPDAAIGFVVKSDYRELVEAHPGITRVHELRGSSSADLGRLCSELRACRYSTVVDLHRNQRSFILGVCSRASIVTAYRKRDPADALRVRVLRRAFRSNKPLVTRYLESLAPLGIRERATRPRLFVSDDAVAGGRVRLAEWGMTGSRFAAVAPAALWETKRWPAERFAAVATALARDRGLDILLVGADSDRELCAEVSRSIDPGGARVVNAAGTTGLGELGAVLGAARIFIGNDSGPMHMAMARGTPTVAIFGPTDPGQFDFGQDSVVYAGLACSACSFYGTRSCRLGHWDCMASIDAGRVVASAFELLDRRPASVGETL
jgi:heptosyltransferase-2